MSPIVYAVPYVPPQPPLDPWRGPSQRWESPDGSVWSISGPGAGGVRLMPGVRGLTWPKREAFIEESAGVHGGRWRGYRDGVREVFWPLSVYRDTDSAGWLDYDAAFWRSLGSDVPGRWVVTHPSGAERYLLVRWLEDGDPPWDFSPGLVAWAAYGARGVAVDPYWRGPAITPAAWSGEPTPGESFFGAGGPPFTISEGSTLASATITNPGDQPAYPVWWVRDVTSVDLTVAGATVEVPAVADDRLLVVDTDPTALSALEVVAPPDGATPQEQEAWVAARLPTALDRTVQLGAGTAWGVIPPEATSPVGIDMVGTGWVRVQIVPRWRRAW